MASRRPHVSLSFGSGAVERQPLKVEYVHHEFEHEMVIATVPAFGVDAKRYRSGVPVILGYGVGPQSGRSFFGYVNHVEPVYSIDRDATGGNIVEKKVVCVGASYVLKDGGYLGFTDTTVPGVVRRIAQDFRFDTTNVRNHPRVFSGLNQSGRTYWEFLVELAKKLGWTFYCSGTSLCFHDRLEAASTSVAHSFSPEGGGLLRFHSQVGHTSPEGGELANRFAYGVNPRSGAPVLGQRKPSNVRPLLGAQSLSALFKRADATQVVGSLGDAHDALEAVQTANQLPVTAKVELAGDPGVQVGGLVSLAGVGPTNGGLWYVTGVRHVFNGPNSYVTHAELGRDAVIANTQRPTISSIVRAPQRRSRLLNDVWVVA